MKKPLISLLDLKEDAKDLCLVALQLRKTQCKIAKRGKTLNNPDPNIDIFYQYAETPNFLLENKLILSINEEIPSRSPLIKLQPEKIRPNHPDVTRIVAEISYYCPQPEMPSLFSPCQLVEVNLEKMRKWLIENKFIESQKQREKEVLSTVWTGVQAVRLPQEGWGWIDKPRGKYAINNQIIIFNIGERKHFFASLMDIYEQEGKVAVHFLVTSERNSSKVRKEIGCINKKFKSHGYHFMSPQKNGFYVLAEYIHSKGDSPEDPFPD